MAFWAAFFHRRPVDPDDPMGMREKFAEFGAGAKIAAGAEFVGTLSNVRIGPGVRIEQGARLECAPDAEIILGRGTVIQARAILDTGPGGRIELGPSNSVNPYCVIYGHGGLVTGSYVRIAAHTVIIPANHIYDDCSIPIAKQGLRKEGIRIEDDVWIGSGCRILDGVCIGRGSVVAAGAVVNRAVDPYSVVGGVPAKLLKQREQAAGTHR